MAESSSQRNQAESLAGALRGERGLPVRYMPGPALGAAGASAGGAAASAAGRSRESIDAPPSTQLMVLGWCLWLLGTWGLSLTLSTAVPASRWMILSAVIGLMLVWPAVRLSEGRGRLSLPGLLVEWLCLLLVFQAVVWPLRVVSDWRTDQTVWLDLAVVSWTLLTAALVGLGGQWRHGGARTVAMVLCVALVLAEPVLVVLTGWPGPSGGLRLSPLAAVWTLTHPVVDVSLAPWPLRVTMAAVAAVAAWVVLAVAVRLVRR